MSTKIVKTQKFKLESEPVDYQITVHFENLKAHYGEEKIKQFLKEFYYGKQAQRQKIKKAE